MDIIFNDGDLHEKLPLTGELRHAFLRATEEKYADILPLPQTVKSQPALKDALYYKAQDVKATACSRVEAPLLLIPDVQCSAFTTEQAGALGGQSVVLSACGRFNLNIVFTETAGGQPDGMYVPVASVFAYEPTGSASGVSFVWTAVVAFKLEFVGTVGKRAMAFAGEDGAAVSNGKGAKLFVLPTTIVKSHLSMPDWRISQDSTFENLIGSAILQAPIFEPLVSSGLLPGDPQVMSRPCLPRLHHPRDCSVIGRPRGFPRGRRRVNVPIPFLTPPSCPACPHWFDPCPPVPRA